MPDKYSEKRKHSRINQNFILSYYDLNDPLVRQDSSQLRNISLGGMCLVTSKIYTVGTRLGIELRTPFLSEYIHIKGTILESKEKIKGLIYETRLEFDQLSEETQKVLKKLIDHFEKEKASKR